MFYTPRCYTFDSLVLYYSIIFPVFTMAGLYLNSTVNCSVYEWKGYTCGLVLLNLYFTNVSLFLSTLISVLDLFRFCLPSAKALSRENWEVLYNSWITVGERALTLFFCEHIHISSIGNLFKAALQTVMLILFLIINFGILSFHQISHLLSSCNSVKDMTVKLAFMEYPQIFSPVGISVWQLRQRKIKDQQSIQGCRIFIDY